MEDQTDRPQPLDSGADTLDADLVCEECGAVNPEGTLLCKVCGNNLRDQRQRRIAGGGQIAFAGEKTNRFRIFTGVISVVGLLTIVAAVLSLDSIEAMLVEAQTEGRVAPSEGLWEGPNTSIFDDLMARFDDEPALRSEIRDAIDNPVLDDDYHGRYVLIVDGLGGPRTFGEALLSRRSDRVFFVARVDELSVPIRGYGIVESESATQRLVVRQTAGAQLRNGEKVLGLGFAERLSGGGHRCEYIVSDNIDDVRSFRAYRIR